MTLIHPTKLVCLILTAAMLLSFGASAATITFDRNGSLVETTESGPYNETVDGVTLTLTSNVHLHLGDWSGDSNPDLRNHAGITDTFTFSEQVNILGFDVVGGNEYGSSGHIFESDTGHQFSVENSGFFDIANSNFASQWQNITVFTWQVLGSGELIIDNLQFEVVDTSPVPVPAAAWLFGSALLGLAGLRRSYRN